MGNKPVLSVLILPDAHRGAAPQVAETVLHDTADNLARQGFRIRIDIEVAFPAVVKEKPSVGTG